MTHIPDEVIASGVTAAQTVIKAMLEPDVLAFGITDEEMTVIVRSVIEAALDAWPRTRMAVIGKGMDELQQFYPAIIIRTEEPK